MEKILLVDADLRRPAIARQFGLKSKQTGLVDAVTGKLELGDAVVRVPDSNLDVLVVGNAVPNPLELLSSARFSDLLAQAGTHYDCVVIDAPPIQAVSDALVLAGLADAVLFVVQADETPAPACRGAIKRLREVRAPMVGVVLNRVSPKSHYGGYYGDTYAVASYGYGRG